MSHRPTSAKASSAPSRLSFAALASALLLVSACSSLQVDVDVYKGPLINHESMQRDQMTSMAMSAKALMLSMRNRLIDNSRPSWTGSEDGSIRNRTLTRQEIADIIGRDWKATDLRNMRQINDILTFYDDWDGEIPALTDRLQEHRQKYDLRMRSVREQQSIARNKLDQDLTALDTVDFGEAHLALRMQWEDLSEVLRLALAVRPALSRRELINSAADGLANLTQPRLLACALALAPQDPALGRLKDEAPDIFSSPLATEWHTAEFKKARTALARVLKEKPEVGLLAIRSADVILLEPPRDIKAACDSSSKALTAPTPSDRSEILLKRFKETGVVRMPRRFDKPDEVAIDEQLTSLAAAVQAAGANGFDNGRAYEGIDRVATKLAQERQPRSDASSGKKPGRGPDPEKIKELESQLDGLLVDLAARIQFLAGNLWLLDDAQSPTLTLAPTTYDGTALPSSGSPEQINRFKALLEGIANNILVHADDLRHRKAHADQQARLGTAEINAQRDAVNISESQAFMQVVQAVRDEKLRVLKAESIQGSTQLSAARSEAEQAAASAKRASDSLAAMAALRTLLAPLTPTSQAAGLSGKLGTDSDWAEDKKRVDKKLAADTSPPQDIKLEALRAQLEALLTADSEGLSNAASQSTPRAKRYVTLLEAAKSLRPLNNSEDLPRTEAIAQLRGRVVESHKALIDANTAAIEFKAKKDLALKKQEGEPAAQAPELGHKVASDKFDAAVDVVMSQRSAVVTALGAQAAPPDARLAANALISKLDALPATDAGKQAATDAKSVIVALNLSRRIDPQAVPDEPIPAKDVLDETITQLRRLHLDAVKRGGKNGAEATRLLEALETARKQREDMIYIRPTGSYLRSVYASTFLQNDPGLRSRNLLLDGWRRILQCKGAEEQVCDIRTQLDKAHWQNINTVRVDGAGGSNFVIAKDDVGNWYVKAMGTDPKAMISAVKGLALYNMGGRFNTDLLRVDELRARVDDTTLEGTDRRLAADELDKLTKTTSGPAVAARTQTLGLFAGNYADRTKQDLDQLAGTVKGDSLQTKIRSLWDGRLTGSNRTKLDEVFGAADVKQSLESARTAVDDATAQKNEGERITGTLGAMHRWRGTLKAQVAKLDGLTETERNAQTNAQTGVDAATAQRDAAETTVVKAKELELVATRKLAVSGLTEAQREQAISEANEAKLAVTKAETDASERRADLAMRKADLTDAQNKLQEAKARQQQLAADVDTVVLGFMDTTIKRRLQLVQETETAVKVVGHRTGITGSETQAPAAPAKP